MSFNEKEFSELESKFNEVKELVNEIQSQDEQENYEKEILIADAYNNVIKYSLTLWNSDDKDFIEKYKKRLLAIYYKLVECLKTLNSKTNLPTTLSQQITPKERPKSQPGTEPQEDLSKSQSKNEPQDDPTNNKSMNEPQEDLLQSTHVYNKDIFQALVDEFYAWDKKINRKNASEKTEIVQERTENIIKAYNDIIDFVQPILQSDQNESKNEIKETLEQIREYIIEDLSILNSDVKVPHNFTTKIVDPSNIDIDDDSKNQNNNSDDKKPELPTNKTNTDDDKKQKNNIKPLPIQPLPIDVHSSKMALTSNDYYGMCSRQLNYTYDGDPLGLPPFIDSIELLQVMDAQKQHENILKGVIWSKLKGKARDYVPAGASVNEIKEKLKKSIKVPSSKIITGRLMALKADKMNFGDYASKAEELAEQLKRAYISEEIPNERANQMTIDQTIELCAANTHSTQTKSVLEATQFDDSKDVIAKFIIQERKQTNPQQVLAFRGKPRFNNRNFQNQNRRYHNQYNNYNNFNNRNGFQARNFNRNNNFNRNRGNYRGRGNNSQNNQNGNWRQNNNNNNNRQPRRGNVYYTENSDALPSGAQQTQARTFQQAEQE